MATQAPAGPSREATGHSHERAAGGAARRSAMRVVLVAASLAIQCGPASPRADVATIDMSPGPCTPHSGSGGSGDDCSFGFDCPDGHTRYIQCYRGYCQCIANPNAFVGDQFTLPESCATPLSQVSALAYSQCPAFSADAGRDP